MTRDERGSAVVEASILGSMLFGVLLQLVVLVGTIHRSMLATSAASRELGRVVAVSDSTAEANSRGRVAVSSIEANYGLAPGNLQVSVGGQVARDAAVPVFVRTNIPLFQIPFVGVKIGPSLPIESKTTVRVDKYRSITP